MIQIGFIGCGGIARHHANYLKKMKEVNILGCFDVSEEAVKSFAKQFDVKHAFTDQEKLLAIEEIQGVIVATPTYYHPGGVIPAAQAGKHVFCEKPMAMSVRDCQRMIEACQYATVSLTMGFVRRYDNYWGAMNDIIQTRRIGRPVIWRSIGSFGGGPSHTWFCDAKLGGGPLLDGAVHNYDYALKMFGPAKRVYASMRTYDPEHTAFDTGTAIIDFKSGDQLIMCWSWGCLKNNSTTSVHDVVAMMGGFSLDAVPPPPGEDPAKRAALCIRSKGEQTLYSYEKNDMFADQMEAWIRTIRDGKAPVSTGWHGLEATTIGLAVLHSAATGQVIDLDNLPAAMLA